MSDTQPEQERDTLKALVREYADALMLAWGGVCPLNWAVDAANPARMGEQIRQRGDELQAAEAKLAAAERREFETRTLALAATNGWACTATTQREHREIDRLHKALDRLAKLSGA